MEEGEEVNREALSRNHTPEAAEPQPTSLEILILGLVSLSMYVWIRHESAIGYCLIRLSTESVPSRVCPVVTQWMALV